MENLLAEVDDESVDACVTDPPYGIKFMSKRWDHRVPTAEQWREVYRTLKPGGYLLSFFGTKTYHRGVVEIEDSGFEIRDQIMWVYNSGMPKSKTTLKPAHEPIVVARKSGPLNLNISLCMVGTRYPANLIHDGSDEVLECFPEAPGQQGAVTGSEPSSKTDNCYGEFSGRTPCEPRVEIEKSAARFFYCAKASKKDRNSGGVSNKHPTVKPNELMRYLCRLVTPAEGTVLDPFCGSGSTGKAALMEGFKFIGFDEDQESIDVAEGRLKAVCD